MNDDGNKGEDVVSGDIMIAIDEDDLLLQLLRCNFFMMRRSSLRVKRP